MSKTLFGTLDITLDGWADNHDDDVFEVLFNEELGAVVQIRGEDRAAFADLVAEHGLIECAQRIARPTTADDIRVLDVTPQLKLRPTTLEEGEQLPEFATTPEERDAREVDPPLGVGDRSENPDDPSNDERASWVLPVLRGIGLSLAALLLLALPLLFLPLAKRRRARVRRAEQNPELRALGAWQELVDGAADDGVAIPVGRHPHRRAHACPH